MAEKRILSNGRGQFITFVAVALIILGLLIGIAIDGGRAYLIRSRLSKVVDAVSMAGARYIVQGFAEAKSRACDTARLNGFDCVENGGTVEVTEFPIEFPDGSTQTGIRASATSLMNTSFMRLGTLIGCTRCENLNVAASSVAAPGLVDVVLVVDDTGTMNGAPVAQARQGAQAVVDKLIQGTSDVVKIGLVPFRGCYSDERLNPPDPPANNQKPGAGCVLFNEIIELTNQSAVISSGINNWQAEGVDCAPPTGEFLPRFEGSAAGGFGFVNLHFVFHRG